MKPFKRADRVGGLIQETLSDILRKKIKDPRLDMTVITGVEMSADLKNARIFFSTSAGSEDRQKEVAAGFQSAMGYIRRTLARELELRYMPTLKFYYDTSFDYGAHIDNVLKKIED
ncbi:30S ribosome-binding factor RbfA [Desulfonema magnum]|uniref:Ribosome-binding factor A n=1 Tax=Desulfonema magnum TaxID=45655 RepID=A0A975GTR5_9BACT|nr:30S ribosome-binding factor RbfA [Desulfonema magnum]QTA93390.1 Ribosome-binding factor [Desulfonema magnum]